MPIAAAITAIRSCEPDQLLGIAGAFELLARGLLLVGDSELVRLCSVEHGFGTLGALGEQHAFERKFFRRVLVPGPNTFAIGYTKPLGQIQVAIADLLHV